MPEYGDITPVANVQDMNAPQFKSPTVGPSPMPKDSAEKKLLARCAKYLQDGKKHRDQYSQDWEKCRKYLYGEQWYDRKRPSYRASPVVNVIWPTVNTILPIMTDIHPGFDVKAKEPNDYKFATMMSSLVQSWWGTNGLGMVIVEALWDALTITHGILKVYWDPAMNNHAGDVRVIAPDPGSILVPRGAVDFQTKCPWVGHVMSKSVGEMKRLFPEHADKIRGTGKTSCLNSAYDGSDNDANGMRQKAESGEAILVSPTNRKSPTRDLVDVQGTGAGSDEDEVEYIEWWLDDWEMEEFEEQGDDGESVTQGKRRKYPRGRLVTVVPDLKLILQDKPNPRADGRKPFVRLIDQAKPREFAGIGEVKPLIEIQQYINKFWATIIDWANRMSNPVWVLDQNSGVSPRMITNQVGLVLVKKPGTTVQRLEGVSLPPQIFQSYEAMREMADTTSGVHDVTAGRKPTGVTAAEAIEELQEAAQTRIRLKDRNLEASMTDLGQLVVNTMLQGYNEPRVVKVTGDSEAWPSFFEFWIEDTGAGYKMNRKEFVYDEIEDDYREQREMNELGVSKGVYDIEVKAGTSLPWMKNKRASEARTLFRDGLIDQKAALDMIDLPNKEETLRRMEEQAAAAAEAQAAAEQGGVPV